MTIVDTTDTALLEARALTVGYGAVPVVHDVNLTVGAGEVVVDLVHLQDDVVGHLGLGQEHGSTPVGGCAHRKQQPLEDERGEAE